MSTLRTRILDAPRRLSRALLTTALVIAALMAGYGLSGVRATHSDPNVLHFCVSHYTGQIRYVVNPTQCTHGYVINVNQQGAPGTPGQDGAPGQDGVSGYEIVSATVSGDVTPEPALAAANCPTGKMAIGGGAAPGIGTMGNGWVVINSSPLSSGTGWAAIVGNFTIPPIANATIHVYAICADVGA